MNMAANSDKMAVTDNQSIIPVHGSESREDNDVKQCKSSNDGTLKKKSTFKITSVTKNPDAADISNDADHDVEHDSMDDLDETVESHTEDASSEIFDVSKHTDGEQPSPMEEETSDHVNHVVPVNSTFSHANINAKVDYTTRDLNSKEREKNEQGPHSTRFKVVKIETTEPFKRGRWTCLDTLDYPAPEKSDTKLNVADSNTGFVSNVNSVHQIDDPSKNPSKSVNVIPSESKENFHPDSQIQQNSISTTVAQSSIAQQPTQNLPAVSNLQNNTGHSQPTPNMNTYVAQGQSSMQTSDNPQTTYIYGGPSTGLNPVQNTTISEKKQFEQEHYGVNDQVIPPLDNQEPSSMITDLQENSVNSIEAQGAILTPQSVAEVVGMMPSPQEEEDRSTGRFSGMNPLTPGGSRGSSTVAIDNKIEQAMDLVKSHLMYAVREEVEVLKEQIKELMDKNSQLEYENQILKNSASPETLAKLSNLPPSSSS